MVLAGSEALGATVTEIERTAHLSAGEQDEVRALAERLDADYGAPPLNDESLARLAAGDITHLLLRDGSGPLAGYAQWDGGSAELAAASDAGGPLLDAVEAAAADGVTIWTHGTRSPLAGLLERRGYRRTRLLHQLRRPAELAVPDVALPAEVTVRPFVVGADEDAWLTLNAAAFADHAEQGGWTRADLDAREAEDWFDPAGFFLALRGERLLAFHWTKIHPDGNGEVYVLGVDPAAQGLRLGAGLLAIGLRHLHDRGCPYVLLYVDDSNAAAVRLYERFGFTRHDRDAQWTLAPR